MNSTYYTVTLERALAQAVKRGFDGDTVVNVIPAPGGDKFYTAEEDFLRFENDITYHGVHGLDWGGEEPAEHTGLIDWEFKPEDVDIETLLPETYTRLATTPAGTTPAVVFSYRPVYWHPDDQDGAAGWVIATTWYDEQEEWNV